MVVSEWESISLSFIVPFTIFHFPPFHFFIASFFPVGEQTFPGQKSLGGTLCPLPPAPRLLRHCPGPRADDFVCMYKTVKGLRGAKTL